jgi:hypothetical protein
MNDPAPKKGKAMAAKKGTEASPDDFAHRWRVHRRLVRLGQALMIAGGLVAITHWLTHIEAFGPGQPPGWLDLAAGYPAGALLLIFGAILAGRRRPSKQTR